MKNALICPRNFPSFLNFVMENKELGWMQLENTINKFICIKFRVIKVPCPRHLLGNPSQMCISAIHLRDSFLMFAWHIWHHLDSFQIRSHSCRRLCSLPHSFARFKRGPSRGYKLKLFALSTCSRRAFEVASVCTFGYLDRLSRGETVKETFAAAICFGRCPGELRGNVSWKYFTRLAGRSFAEYFVKWREMLSLPPVFRKRLSSNIQIIFLNTVKH